MQLKDLLNGIEIVDTNIDLNIICSKISSDSRKTIKNGIFVAIRGTIEDGNQYINDALKNGVIAVVTDSETICNEKIPFILVNDSRNALAKMWSNYYHNPTQRMKIIAVTGTNGKTTSAYLIYNILKASKKSCALISTIDVLINDEKIEIGGGSEITGKKSAMTTPDPEILYDLFDKMRTKKIEYVVMEASSHALEQNKLSGCNIEIGIFTNLSHDHLDFHKDMSSYFSAKEKLFKVCKLGIVNVDDKYGQILTNRYRGRIITYSCKDTADLYVIESKKSGYGNKFTICNGNNQILIESRLVGGFNIYNCLCAILCADSLGLPMKYIKNGIKNTKCIKGRLEKYKKRRIYIDYAHTPEAMECVINEIRGIYPKNKLIVVFGCGGDRDKEKRPKMGRIATEKADLTIITSDNSRSENQQEIFADILKGIDKDSNYHLIEDREKAIKCGVDAMKRNGVLLLLGKGHETYQIDKKGKNSFDERLILDKILKHDK